MHTKPKRNDMKHEPPLSVSQQRHIQQCKPLVKLVSVVAAAAIVRIWFDSDCQPQQLLLSLLLCVVWSSALPFYNPNNTRIRCCCCYLCLFLKNHSYFLFIVFVFFVKFTHRSLFTFYFSLNLCKPLESTVKLYVELPGLC